MSEEIKKFRTACNSCIFAISEPSPSLDGAPRQVGCELGRTDKFSMKERLFTGPDGFFIVDGICNTCRGEKWKGKHEGVDLVSVVLKEIELTVDMVLYSVDDVCDRLAWKVGRAVGACVKQKKIKPSSIIVVVKNNEAPFQEIYSIIQDLTQEHDIPFQLVRVMEDDADVGRCVEMGIEKCKHQYTAVFDVEHTIPNNVIVRLDELVNHDMKRVLMVNPIISYNGLIITTQVFEMLGKNYNFPIFQKVQEVAEEQLKESLIINWESL